jgi:hypothetical protein
LPRRANSGDDFGPNAPEVVLIPQPESALIAMADVPAANRACTARSEMTTNVPPFLGRADKERIGVGTHRAFCTLKPARGAIGFNGPKRTLISPEER